ncbi:TolC family protein, partial [bacterium]|nr:TolC family protein [bacterium]
MKLLAPRIVPLAFVVSVVASVAAGPVSAEPLSLAACEQLALRANLDAAQAEGSLKTAEADVTSARAAFLPSVTLSGTISKPEDRIEVFQGGELKFFDKTYSADAQARLTLFDGGRNWSDYRAATRGREAAEGRLLSARQGVLYETAVRYYSVARSQELMEVAEKAAVLSDEQRKKTKAMKDLGAATQADVYKAEVDHSNARLEEIRAKRDLRVALASLADFIGRS